jgi:hypothetical protein
MHKLHLGPPSALSVGKSAPASARLLHTRPCRRLRGRNSVGTPTARSRLVSSVSSSVLLHHLFKRTPSVCCLVAGLVANILPLVPAALLATAAARWRLDDGDSRCASTMEDLLGRASSSLRVLCGCLPCWALRRRLVVLRATATLSPATAEEACFWASNLNPDNVDIPLRPLGPMCWRAVPIKELRCWL